MAHEVTINGEEVPVTGEPGIDVAKCIASSVFTDWVSSVDPAFLVERVHLQSVDMFGPNIGFMKFRADTFDRESHAFLPGIVFMRGGSVGILTILVAEESGDEYAIAVRQPRLPIGSFESLEIPAGMLDGSGNFAGKAASEMKEETGIQVTNGDLVDLTEMVQGGKGHKGVWLSPGGSDEFMRFFLYRKKWPMAEIEALEGKLTGLRESGELIKLTVLPYEDLIAAPDGKTLCAIALYDRMCAPPPPAPPACAAVPDCLAAAQARSVTGCFVEVRTDAAAVGSSASLCQLLTVPLSTPSAAFASGHPPNTTPGTGGMPGTAIAPRSFSTGSSGRQPSPPDRHRRRRTSSS